MRRLAALVALLVAAGDVRAAAVARREDAAAVAAALAGLRRPGPRRPPAVSSRRVYVVVDSLDPGRRAALEAAGLAIEVPAPGVPSPVWRDGVVVQGHATPAAERALAALPFVRRLEAPGDAWPNVGAVTTAGVGVHRSDDAAAVLGTAGEGVTIGVVSDGADDRAASVASGDLPAAVAVAPGAGAGAGNEGTALLELVHDTAPSARLLFAGVQTSVEMVAAIDALAAAGARVIVDDLVFTDEPKFEDGPIAVAARRFVQAGGVYVTAAGNFGRRHYLAPWRAGAGRTLGATAYAAVHDFGGGDFGATLRLGPGAQVVVVLQWNEPSGRARNDFDLVLARASGEVLAVSEGVQDGTGTPLEAVAHANASAAPETVWVAIPEFAHRTSALLVNLHVFARGEVTLEHVVPDESVFGHAAVEEVLSVAAVAAADPGRVESFGSHGPATLYFPARLVRSVPRLAAVDGVETAVGRRGAFANPFFGTSAAAPHVAGCAALLLAAGVAADAAARALLATAIDVARPGFDPRAGAGRLDCAAAARLASGRRSAATLTILAARFDPTAALTVSASGTDADADARTATVRVLGSDGRSLVRREVDVVGAGVEFGVQAGFRAGALARARRVQVRVTDATGLAGPPAAADIVCTGEQTVGDAFCAAGALGVRLADTPGRSARRCATLVHRATSALGRAGRAVARGRRPVAALGAAERALERAARIGAGTGVPPDVVADVLVQAARVRALRENFTGPSSTREAPAL